MSTFIVPPFDEEPWPSLGGQVCDLIEERAVFGPGSLKGLPAKLDDEKRAAIWKAYELFPKGHELAGRRRFRRVRFSWRKGSSKTELMAWIAYAELHPEGPVRFDGWDSRGNPVGRPVPDPYIPLLAYTAEQVEELAFGALYTVCTEGPDADLFDSGLERIIRLDDRGKADGKAVPVGQSPSARDGARTSFQGHDEPLALDTPVPTLRGWVNLGDLSTTDQVFGRDGAPLRVLGASPVHVGRRCYRVTFRDGTSVVTDSGHRWKAIDWSNRPRGEQVVTTEQMFLRGTETSYGLRWRLPRGNGVDGSAQDLPIDPYLLGLWLGDGATDAGYVHTAPEDHAEMSAGIAHTVSRDSRPGVTRWLPTGLRSALRSAGLLGNKHIPDIYQRASRSQRLDLLRGLMDTDGHATSKGQCTFTQGRHALADEVCELVRSLGAQASLVHSPDERSRTGEMWRVMFSPSFCPFRLGRKARRYQWRERTSTRWPAVESIVPVASVPVRCIAVDSDDHLFVFGRGFHLTHNTHRLDRPRHLHAYETMEANLPKRPLDDPWSLGVTTAGVPGSGSVAEKDKDEAEAIARGEVEDPELFYFHREAGPGHDLTTLRGRIEAVREASGPAIAAWSDLRGIAKQWDRPGADLRYLERTWLNRWTQADAQAFDAQKWRKDLHRPDAVIPAGDPVSVGFDGSRWKDTTALVVTHLRTGLQLGRRLWVPDEDHPVDPLEVDQIVDDVFTQWHVTRLYGDPAQGWDEHLARWAGRHGPRRVLLFYTDSRNLRRTATMCRSYAAGIKSGEVTWTGDDEFARHIGAAQRRDIHMTDEDGTPLWLMEKERHDSPNKIDYAMAGALSWQARLDSIAAGDDVDPVDSRMMMFR